MSLNFQPNVVMISETEASEPVNVHFCLRDACESCQCVKGTFHGCDCRGMGCLCPPCVVCCCACRTHAGRLWPEGHMGKGLVAFSMAGTSCRWMSVCTWPLCIGSCSNVTVTS